jgi:hypothetical protein
MGTDPCSPESVASFTAYVKGTKRLPDHVRKSILRKAEGAEHVLCDVGNINGGLRKLEDIGSYVDAQAGKMITEDTATVLTEFVASLIAQSEAGQDLCASPG